MCAHGRYLRLLTTAAVRVLVELAREPLQFSRADEAFLARILDGLAGQSQPSRCFHDTQHTFRHGRDRQAFVGDSQVFTPTDFHSGLKQSPYVLQPQIPAAKTTIPSPPFTLKSSHHLIPFYIRLIGEIQDLKRSGDNTRLGYGIVRQATLSPLGRSGNPRPNPYRYGCFHADSERSTYRKAYR